MRSRKTLGKLGWCAAALCGGGPALAQHQAPLQLAPFATEARIASVRRPEAPGLSAKPKAAAAESSLAALSSERNGRLSVTRKDGGAMVYYRSKF